MMTLMLGNPPAEADAYQQIGAQSTKYVVRLPSGKYLAMPCVVDEKAYLHKGRADSDSGKPPPSMVIQRVYGEYIQRRDDADPECIVCWSSFEQTVGAHGRKDL
jgi:hypothetical protein